MREHLLFEMLSLDVGDHLQMPAEVTTAELPDVTLALLIRGVECPLGFQLPLRKIAFDLFILGLSVLVVKNQIDCGHEKFFGLDANDHGSPHEQLPPRSLSHRSRAEGACAHVRGLGTIAT